MKNKNKLKQVNTKVFIIPIIMTTLIFFVIGQLTINKIKSYYYNNLEESSLSLARNYSQSVSKSTEAYDIVNALLEEKMLVASRATALYEGSYTNAFLEELATALEVDEIDYYDSNGELIYSNINELVGWVAPVGHPVHDFMIGEESSYIGNIRPDSITGNYYKYGYFKVSNGGFLQIGVKADAIRNFLGSFEMQQLLDDMHEVGFVSRIRFIDNQFYIIGSTDETLIGDKINSQDTKLAITQNKEYGMINEEKQQYEVFVPVYVGEDKIGTLTIEQSLSSTVAVVKQFTTIGLLALGILYTLVFYIILSTFRKNRRLTQLALYDALTGLPNKEYLNLFLLEEIEKNKDELHAVLLINCVNFRIVNLTYGYEYGDALLIEMYKRIKVITGFNTKLFRFSADRVVMYIKNYNGQKELIAITNRIIKLYESPITVNNIEQNLDVQIGVVEINHIYQSVDQILKDGSIALSYIDHNEAVKYALFNEVMRNKLKREEMIEKELRAAIASNDEQHLYLEYQPLLDLKENKITSFEALARMNTDALGYISPFEFITVAEKKQLIVPLGNLILKKACKFINTLAKEGYGHIVIAVNISVIQLLRSDFVETVMEIVKESGIKESNLELEITESVFLDNYKLINHKLKKLRDHKIGIALDDFGTGYSSFSRLRELNIDIVKIDGSFIKQLPNRSNKELITGDIISMSHKIGLRVVAEGVELEMQKDYLVANNCDLMQGYLFSKSLSETMAIDLLKANDSEK